MFRLFATRVGPKPPRSEDDFEGLVLGIVTLGVLVMALPLLIRAIGA